MEGKQKTHWLKFLSHNLGLNLTEISYTRTLLSWDLSERSSLAKSTTHTCICELSAFLSTILFHASCTTPAFYHSPRVLWDPHRLGSGVWTYTCSAAGRNWPCCCVWNTWAAPLWQTVLGQTHGSWCHSAKARRMGEVRRMPWPQGETRRRWFPWVLQQD